MNDVDLSKLAERLDRLAELVRTRGRKALTVAAEWTSPRHPNAIGGGPDFTTPRDKLDKLDPLRHQRLVANFGRLDADVATLTGLILDTVPREPDKPRDDEVPEGACENCWTDNRHFEPVSHYARSCRWCGDFKGDQGRYPPRALLRKRHAGQRVTTADVEKALGRTA